MSQRILITGASGFLGSYLLRACLDAGYLVLAYKRRETDLWRLQDIKDQVIWFDLDKGGIVPPFAGKYRVDHVIHTATSYGRNNESSSELVATNLYFPLQVFELSAAHNVKTFFNSDTVLERSLNAYALSKKQFCDWLRVLAGKTKVINIRLEHMYGPKDDSTKFVSYLIEQCLQNTRELRLTLGEQKRDFIFITDVIAAYLCLLDKHEALTQHYNDFAVGSGNTISIKELVELIANLTASKSELEFGALPYRDNEVMESKADISSFKELGWEPKIRLEDGLLRTIKAYKEGGLR